MKPRTVIILVVVFVSIIAIGITLFKNKENIILTGFGTTQWDLYKSYCKEIVSSNYAFKLGKMFHEVGVYELSWDGRCNYYLVNQHQELERFKVSDVITSNNPNKSARIY